MKKDLSIIIPYIQEYPQILFTIRSIHEQLKDIDHEIIAVDNLCPPAIEQLKSRGKTIDKGHKNTKKDGSIQNSHIKSMSEVKGNEWLKYIYYEDHFSHWQAKNEALRQSKSDFIMFIDAHCVPSHNSIPNMYKYYVENWEELNGSIHLPLTYHILESRKLIYQLIYDKEIHKCEYSFSSMPKQDIFEVPCMSSCGMMLHKSFFDKVGLFPQTGIYSGGEHFLNFVSSIIGRKKWIYAKDGALLHHHGEKRDYHYTWGCYQYNRIVANYMFGGEKWARYFVNNLKISEKDREKLFQKVVSVEANQKQREKIKKQQVINIEDWAEEWVEKWEYKWKNEWKS